MFLSMSILDTAPPLVVFLPVVLLLQGLALLYGPPSPSGRNVRLVINLVSLFFIAFFALQGVLAHPGRYFAMPVGALILVMAGIAMENLAIVATALWRRFVPSAPKPG